MNVARIIVAPTMALVLAGGLFAGSVGANAKGDQAAAMGCECGVIEGPAVVIDGGTVTNETNIQVSANAGTAISDASGGSNNVAIPGGDGGVAVAGQGGGANAAANGGAVSLGDINSGGNAGNAITVGNTIACAPCPEAPKPVAPKPVKEAPVKEAPAPAPAAPVVAALPSTGVGGIDAGLLSALAAAGAAGAAGLGFRRRS